MELEYYMWGLLDLSGTHIVKIVSDKPATAEYNEELLQHIERIENGQG